MLASAKRSAWKLPDIAALDLGLWCAQHIVHILPTASRIRFMDLPHFGPMLTLQLPFLEVIDD